MIRNDAQKTNKLFVMEKFSKNLFFFNVKTNILLLVDYLRQVLMRSRIVPFPFLRQSDCLKKINKTIVFYDLYFV